MEKSEDLKDERAFSTMLHNLRQLLLDSKAKIKELTEENAAQRKEINRKCKENEEEVRSLEENLHLQEMETEKVKKSWKAERDQLNEINLSLDKTVIQLNEEWGSRWFIRRREAVAKLETLQQCYERKMSQVIKEKDDVITSVREETMALVEGNLRSLAKVREIEMKICQGETEKKVEMSRTTRGLQKHIREVEEKWLHKEEVWLHRARSMEEEKKLLMLRNVELQVLALQTEENVKMKRAEKKRMWERKERVEREKKEREESKRKAKKRLKRENKENKKRERMERKENERERRRGWKREE